MSELQEDLQLLVDSLRYRSGDEEQQRQALQTIATMCTGNGIANEYFCEHGGLDLVMEMVKTNGTAAGVKQASLYCISAVIEENVSAQMKLCNEKMFQCIRELLECEKSSNGLKATAVYFINSLIHNNGTGQNLCHSSKVLLKLINMFKVYVDPMVGTDGASANNNGDIAGKTTSRTADGLELWISVCNTLGTACNNPQNEINQQRCAQLFAGAVSLLRPPVNHRMVRPAVSLLNYCISGHYMNKERIRLVGGLQAILTLLKELLSGDPCHADHHEQAIHLVRLLTTCVTDNGVNQKVASQLEVVPVLLQLLKNELLDTSQKLCIVMCLAVLSEGNTQIQQQLADNNGFGLLVQVIATSKNDELCRVVIYVLHSCLKEKTNTDDQLGDDIERLDAMLNTSHELTKHGRYDEDEQTPHGIYQLTDKEVTVEEKHCHVQQWLDRIGADNVEDTNSFTCETKPTEQLSCLVPLLQLLLAKGILDEVKSHLPASIQDEVDKLCHKPLTMQENENETTDGKAVPCTHVNQKQDCMEDNANNTFNPTFNYQTNKEVMIDEKELVMGLNNTETKQGVQERSSNDNKSLFMDGSTNIVDAESRAADKHKIIKENALVQRCIDSPLLPRECQMMSEKAKNAEKNAAKLNFTLHSTEPNPMGLGEEANRVHWFARVSNLVPGSSKNIHHTTPCFHQGPKRLLKPIMVCLGCAPRPDGIILTSRNYLCSLQRDEHTCAFHKKLAHKHFNSTLLQKSHHIVESSSNIEVLTECADSIQVQLDNTLTDHKSTELQLNETLTDHNHIQLQLHKIESVADHDTSQPLNQGLLRCNDESNSKHDKEASVLQDITNEKSLSAFDYHTPMKQEQRPTQMIFIKPFKTSSSHVDFTPNEEKFIMDGVQKFGKRWRHILNAYPFHPSRTQVNIKDKYRQLYKK